MNAELQEELLRLNSKVDHIGRIVCELFVMTKSNELWNEKIDICIKSLNSLNSKIETIEKNKLLTVVPNPPVPPLPPPLPRQTTVISSSSTNQNKSDISHSLLLQELKEKLKNKLII